MTTYTIQGYSRVMDWGTSTWTSFAVAEMQIIRPDGLGDMTWHYQFIDETMPNVGMVQVTDYHSLSAVVSRAGADGYDLMGSAIHMERFVYALEWGAGKVTYIHALFQPMSGEEFIFAMGGDTLPAITSLAQLNTLLEGAQRWVLDGPFEGGNAIPLANFQMTTVSEADRIVAKSGTPLLWDAGLGNDTLTGADRNDTLIGGVGNDRILGYGGVNVLIGGAGTDTIIGAGDQNQIQGGAGNDLITSTATSGSEVQAGAGNDRVTVGAGVLVTGIWSAYNHVNGGSGADTITGNAANDNLNGDNGVDEIHGGLGDDFIGGGRDGDNLYGDGGGDMINGMDGDDSIEGNDGNDHLFGHAGMDSIYGNDGDDQLFGIEDNDYLNGGIGADTLDGGDGDDSLYGEAGDDVMLSGDGSDVLFGGDGADSLAGGDMGDRLNGGTGKDTLEGEAGNDTLAGNAGADLLTGGLGADDFRFLVTADSTAANRDTVQDFSIGVDDIDLSAIDADATTAGNQAFIFRGTGAFTAAGQVRLAVAAGDTVVQADTNGDGTADLSILIDNATGLTAGDFIL